MVWQKRKMPETLYAFPASLMSKFFVFTRTWVRGLDVACLFQAKFFGDFLGYCILVDKNVHCLVSGIGL